MKKILFLGIVLSACLQMSAADVDANAARAAAMRYIQQTNTAGRHMAPSRNNDLALVHAEANPANSSQALYYIFNTSDSYYIVAGDDRAREVLAHGDSPIDMNNIPASMQVWLEGYKKQIEYLQSHPDMEIQKGARRVSSHGYGSVEPLLTALWDQSYPYNLQCPLSNGLRCLTGCPATSLAMVFYYWKYPTGPTPPVSGYTTSSLHLQVESLPSTTFDWDNMLDRYHGNFNDDQANAVACLMRYLGQAERMDYTPEASGSYGENIVSTIKLFGYDPDVRIIYKDRWNGINYTDDEWAAIIQEELSCARPIVMCAYTATWSGHAFNIDGYDADDDTYHINWGWSGSSNAFFALNAFRGGGMVFNMQQQLIIGIEPPATMPTIKPSTSRLTTKAYVDSTATASLVIKGALLTDDINLTLDDPSGFFKMNIERISQQESKSGKRVRLTYTPTSVGSHNATIKLTSAGAEEKVVHLSGTCLLETYDPVMVAVSDVTQSSFNAQWQDVTPQHNVASYNLEIAPIPFSELRINEAFDKTEYSGTSAKDCSSQLDDITNLPGWSGSKLYRSNNNLLMGTSKSRGWIETPPMDMYGNNGKVTVKITARSTNSDVVAPLIISCCGNDTTIELSSTEAEYCVMLPCPAIEDATVRLSNLPTKRITLSRIQILAGDDYSPVDLNRASYLEGITSTSQLLEDMQPGYYGLRVQALYIDGKLSPWSNRIRVFVPWKKGDVNHDGEINIADANQIVDTIMLDITSASAVEACDINGDGEINIADINAIIEKIQSGN